MFKNNILNKLIFNILILFMDIKELFKILNKIPDDVILNKIIPYSYNTQPDDLLEDIKSFVKTYNHVYDLYYIRYKSLVPNNLYIAWLKNDIATFMNNINSTLHGYTDNCVKKYKRHFMLKNKNNGFIRSFVWNIYNNYSYKVSIKINIGLLNPNERKQMINFFNLII